MRFWKHASQGSAATGLRYGEIRNDHFVENFLLNLAVKEFLKID